MLKSEREQEVSHVIVDESKGFASSIPWIGELTTPCLLWWHLHRRNANSVGRDGSGLGSYRENNRPPR